ncbi:hypothetical protein SAMN05216553_111180 [Lentzea fradiae]|uniref:Uncharacterized protein n=1 Tax=Lentzea fradiae TaxID=200378 RepID=A0A1G7X1Y8_9PSEU|nr:hypothetical protein SAMN05216553_111180 [Lentzea fradiae]
MVHPSTDIFSRRGLGWPDQSVYPGVRIAMRALVAAALLFAAVLTGPATGDREHILGDVDTSSKREHIL